LHPSQLLIPYDEAIGSMPCGALSTDLKVMTGG
jgi:hypothetical protein